MGYSLSKTCVACGTPITDHRVLCSVCSLPVPEPGLPEFLLGSTGSKKSTTTQIRPGINGSEIKVPMALFVAMLRSCGGEVCLDEADMTLAYDPVVHQTYYPETRQLKVALTENT